MKKFEYPTIEIVEFNVEDIITDSVSDDEMGDNQLPGRPVGG